MPFWTWMLIGGLCLATGLESFADEPLGAFPPDTPPEMPALTPAEELVMVVYPVADLVLEPEPLDSLPSAVAVENSPTAAVSHARHDTLHQRALQNMAEISMIVQSIVAPESWEQTGGAGRIAVHGGTYSLIVRQTPAVQEGIAHLLSELRRLEVEIELSWREVAAKDAGQEPALLDDALAAFRTPLTPVELEQPLQALREVLRVQPALELRLQNGRPADLGALRVTAVAAADRRSVRLHLVPAVAAGSRATQFYCRIDDQRTTLLPINWNGCDGSVRVLVTARIRVPEEVEEPLLPIPVDDGYTVPTPVDEEHKVPTPPDQVASQPPDRKPTPR